MTSASSLLGLETISVQRSAIGNNTVGYNVLKSHSLPTSDYWYWVGVGVLLLYAFLFNNIVTLALAYLNRKFE
jgi:hypothetical protein